jgi:TetR/AcrR family transcriptional regulator
MIDETERKILDAALKLFAKKGYTDATAIAIADKAGFNEKTIFRKFKTKKNLYNQVLKLNAEKFMQEMGELVFVDKKFDTPQDFLKHYIKNAAKVYWDNFEFFNLSIYAPNEEIVPIMKDGTDFVGEYIEKKIPNLKLDYRIFGLSINAFIYAINVERFQGRTYINYDDAIEKFISNTIHCISNTPSIDP